MATRTDATKEARKLQIQQDMDTRRVQATTRLWVVGVMSVVGLVGLYAMGYVDLDLYPHLAPSPSKLEGEVKWEGDFTLVFRNMADTLFSVRGERIVQMTLLTILGCFALQVVLGLLFRLFTDRQRYDSYDVRDQWFLAQK
jgi:hypothetical protein